jgi:hypothetical protein
VIVTKPDGESEGFNVDLNDLNDCCAVDSRLISPSGHKVIERRASECEIGTSVEFWTMCPVHFAPASSAVGAEPKIRLIKISEEKKLSDFPHR